METAIQHIPLLIDTLNNRNFKISAYDYTLLQRTLIELAKRQQFPKDTTKLKNILSPILCNNKEEQKLFEEIYEQWIKNIKIKHYEVEMHSNSKLNEGLETNRKDTIKFIGALVTIVFIVILLGYFSENINILLPNLPNNPDGPSPGPGNPLLNQILLFIKKNWPYGLILTVIVMVTGWFYYKFTSNIYLKRKLTNIQKNLRTFFLRPFSIQLNNAVTNSKLASKLRKRRTRVTPNIDIPATIQKSIDNLGFYTFVPAHTKEAVKYLLLIDKKGYYDIQVQLIERFTEILEQYEVEIEKLYFDKDPRSSYSLAKNQAFNLVELSNQYSTHQLIIFSTTDYFVEIDRMQKWIDQTNIWQSKVIFSPPNYRVGKQKFELLKKHGFNTFSFDEEGITIFIHQTQIEQLNGIFPDKTIPISFQYFSIEWLQDKKPPKDDIVYILDSIIKFLSPNELLWFAACAAYPEVNWNLTILFGKHLRHEKRGSIYSQTSLTVLSQLPWMRYAKIPNWLRYELLALIPKHQLNEIKRIIRSIFSEASEKEISDFSLSYVPLKPYIFNQLRQLLVKDHKTRHRRDTVIETLFSWWPKQFISSVPRIKKEVQGNFSGSNISISRFQALTISLGATIGNGNIAGVALAIALGGPGATFWMIIGGFLAMTLKFVEVTLGLVYQEVDKDGNLFGGPMYYLNKGLKERGWGRLGRVLATIFATFCVGGSLGGGNAAQSNQATIVIKDLLGWQSIGGGTVIGVILAILVGIIIIGDIKRIAWVMEKIVPFMLTFYITACLYIIFTNFSFLDDAFGQIFSEAFSPRAGVGAMIGVLLIGFKRAFFSSEAGIGSASIVHSAVKTKYPASEGLVALLEPFIDTVVICTMTALVIIIFNMNGAFTYGGDGTGAVLIDGVSYEGAGITSQAFAQYIPYSNVFLTIAVVLFAVSTMISWSYYGLQSWKFLFGRGKTADLVYKLIFCLFIVIGAAANMGSIWAFSDAMIFAMVFPNMIGLFILFPKVRMELKRFLDYVRKVDVIKSHRN